MDPWTRARRVWLWLWRFRWQQQGFLLDPPRIRGLRGR